ncbi:MAG TPA: RNA-binding S4 domain-containing protein [Alphaproteobacteria bacterium]|nr:RNA-binding S4 domain-containing protein [Alphaproteobacteria bacterium]
MSASDAIPDKGDSAASGAPGASLRLDKWLWHARFFKSRSLAAKLCAAGKLRLNRAVVHKAHQPVRPGDVLTFPQGWHIRVVRVIALGARRGPAAEARRLYEDLAPVAATPAEAVATLPAAPRAAGEGRPTKKERRAIDRLRPDPAEED